MKISKIFGIVVGLGVCSSAMAADYNVTRADMLAGKYKVGDVAGNKSVDLGILDNEYHLAIYVGNYCFKKETLYKDGIKAGYAFNYVKGKERSCNTSEIEKGYVTEPAVIEVWDIADMDWTLDFDIDGVRDAYGDLIRVSSLADYAGAKYFDSSTSVAGWNVYFYNSTSSSKYTGPRPNKFKGVKYRSNNNYNAAITCSTAKYSIDGVEHYDFGVYRSGLTQFPYYGCQDEFDSSSKKNVVAPGMSQKFLGFFSPRYTTTWTYYPTGMSYEAVFSHIEGYPSGGSWPVYTKGNLVLRKGKFRSDTFVVWSYGVGAGEKIFGSSSYNSKFDPWDRPSAIFEDKLNWRSI